MPIRNYNQRSTFIRQTIGFTRWLVDHRYDFRFSGLAEEAINSVLWPRDLDNLTRALALVDSRNSSILGKAWCLYQLTGQLSCYPDSIQEWLLLRTQPGRTATALLRDDYHRYCYNRHCRPESTTVFGNTLTTLGYRNLNWRRGKKCVRARNLALKD